MTHFILDFAGSTLNASPDQLNKKECLVSLMIQSQFRSAVLQSIRASSTLALSEVQVKVKQVKSQKSTDEATGEGDCPKSTVSFTIKDFLNYR